MLLASYADITMLFSPLRCRRHCITVIFAACLMLFSFAMLPLRHYAAMPPLTLIDSDAVLLTC